jgi:hypothetical protein
MYRGVVRVFPQPQPVNAGDEPVPPIEKELARTIDSLKEGMKQFEENMSGPSQLKSLSTQTELVEEWFGSNGPMDLPVGYAVPRIFVRSAAEAIEQAVITYCPGLVSASQREKGMIRLLQDIAEYVRSPRNLYFEIFEMTPTWYDYVKIVVTDHVTADLLASADLIPPETKTFLTNVNPPLYDSPIIKDDAIPHFPQVELSFLRFRIADFEDPKNRVIAQSVTVPLDLFVKAGSVLVVLEDGSEREVSYKAALVRNPHI